MNRLIVIVLLLTIIGCDRKPYVNHKLKLDKISEECSDVHTNIQVLANIAGERYEFRKCLPDNFDKDNVSSERKGDTVVLNFKKPASGQKEVEYKLTLDIDTYPGYEVLAIDNETYRISVRKN
jgi:hypothetical protein